jgi:glycosyltransferase involved in cell wall biosynthesis
VTAAEPPAGRGVVVDLQAIPSVDQRHRGIPRYITDLTAAVEAIDPGAVGTYTVNPDLALPEVGVAERLVEAGKLRRSDDVDWTGVPLLHIASPMEMSVPERRLLPPGARAAGVPWAVTFYDLIPHLMPDFYLEDPGLRRRYRARLQLVRTATAVLTLSEASRIDVAEHLGIDPRRIFVVGAGTSPRFVSPASRTAAAAEAVAAVPGLRAPYVFYIGSYERRKNLEPLLEAWSQLPPAVRGRWQLALCCPLRPLERNHLLWRSRQLGIADSICLTGFVDDAVLLKLHQGTDLFVFPSLYEGYGLPVAEALACGAPVLAADASSLPEIVGPDALFDATRPAAMATAIERGLTDDALRSRLLAAAGKAPSSWDDVAHATLDVYARLLSGELSAPPSAGAAPPTGLHLRRTGVEKERRSGPSTGADQTGVHLRRTGVEKERWKVAFAAALPPDGGEAGGWNAAVLAALASHPDLEVHAFADRPAGGDFERSVFAEGVDGTAPADSGGPAAAGAEGATGDGGANGAGAATGDGGTAGAALTAGDRRSSRTGGVRQERRIGAGGGGERARRRLSGPGGVIVRPLAALEAVEGLGGAFDAVVYVVADDADHTGCLAALRRRRDGVVIAHQAGLSDLYGHAARSGGLAGGLQATIRAASGDGVHPGVGAGDRLPTAEARRLGILLVRDVLAHCHRLILRRPADAALADLDAAPEDRVKIQLAGTDPGAVAAAVYELVSAGGADRGSVATVA